MKRVSKKNFVLGTGLLVLGVMFVGVGVWILFSDLSVTQTEKIWSSIGLGGFGLLITAASANALRKQWPHLRADMQADKSMGSIDVQVRPYPVVCGEPATVEVTIEPDEPTRVTEITAVLDAYDFTKAQQHPASGSPLRGERPKSRWSAGSTREQDAALEALEAGETATLTFELETPEDFTEFELTDELNIDRDTGEYLGVEPPEWYRHGEDLRWRVRILLETDEGGRFTETEQIDGDLSPLVDALEA